MLHAFLLSFGVIFVAELGDKSQLLALAFATRYKTVPVLIAITLATGIVHLFSVALGGVIGTALPTKLISIVGAIAFVGFGIWTLRGDELTEKDKESTKVSSKNIIIAVGTVFFLAELGDKTMLATVTLATTEGLVGTWAGSTVGMVVAGCRLRLCELHRQLHSLYSQPSCSPTHCANSRPGAWRSFSRQMALSARLSSVR